MKTGRKNLDWEFMPNLSFVEASRFFLLYVASWDRIYSIWQYFNSLWWVFGS